MSADDEKVDEVSDETERADEGLAASEDEAARQRAEHKLYTVIGSLLFTLIVLMVNYLSFRHFERFDWTRDTRFTLSERTEQVLADLDRDVQIVLFFSSGEPELADVLELVQQYAGASDRVTVRQVDPLRQPAEVQQLAARYDVDLIPTGEGTLTDAAAIVVAGDRRWKITRDDLTDVDFSDMETGGAPRLSMESEKAFTSAILRVVSGEETTLCVASGHGEYGVGQGERNLVALRDELERENFAIETFDAAGLRRLPEGCAAVLVLGPLRAWAAEEVEVVLDYVREGGRLLLALDPILDRRGVNPSGWGRPLADFGVLLDEAIFFERSPARMLQPDPTSQILVQTRPHPITETLVAMQAPVLVDLAQTVRTEGPQVSTLLEGSEASFGKVDLAAMLADPSSDLAPDDLPGPIGIGAAVDLAEEDAPDAAAAGRMVIVGDSGWLANEALARPEVANLMLAMSTMGWLAEREELVSIPTRESDLQALALTEEDMGGIWIRVMLLLPGAFLLLGFAVWWSRRQ
ncbi:MAG: hypothetical protein CMN30_19775 [Sandaracinus sp.]|nr:hypothetical protein [Sandaracinus sp.]